MAELSSPLQVTGLIENNCSSDTGIFSIYRFIGDDYGKEYIGFAIFYSVENDMDSEWLKKVKLLWENGTTTEHGTQFLDEKWKVDLKKRVYRNNKNRTIKFRYGPFDRNGEKIEIPGEPEDDIEAVREITSESEKTIISHDDINAAKLVREIDPNSEDVNDLNMLEELICDRIESIDMLYELAMEESVHPHAKAMIFPKIEKQEHLFTLAMNKTISANVREYVLVKIADIDKLKQIAKANKELKKFIKTRIKKLK